MINLPSGVTANVRWRLRTERIIWLATVSPGSSPCQRPVWFLWDEERILIYSKPRTQKLKHIRSNNRVSLNFDGDGMGGNIAVFNGTAEVTLDYPPAHMIPAFVEKYEFGFARIGLSAEEYSNQYSVPILVSIVDCWGH